jgi:uncharacterized protein
MTPPPRCIAVVGASSDRRKFSNKCVRAYLRAGWTVYPIHPTATIVEGLPVARTVADIPVTHLDRVSVYLPPAVGITAANDWPVERIGEVWLNPGADAPQVVAACQNRGLTVVCDCSIVAVGFSPSEFADE